ncbi:MAG: radical SAM protein [Thermodesulfobacteriota bacterium]|jgi:MoaA/NifB/PqqE/SkfB family radical SAM enzyme|nr:MAG: radical SAM protein [Thermodesulfobacteriota bacterium]
MSSKSRLHWSIDLLDFYFRRKILGQKIPLLASFKITYRCNLKCHACPFHQKAQQQDSHISWELAITVIENLKRAGCRFVIFEGGEPLLWADGGYEFTDLVQYAKKLFLRVGVTTNGTLPLNVPTDVLWVSLDGLKETHDFLRSNSFDTVWSNINSAHHPRLLIHFTINKQNWRDLDELVERLREVPAVKGLTVQLFYPYGQDEKPLALSLDERKAALEKTIKLKKSGYPILNSINRLRAMMENKWVCHDDILINAEPNAKITVGCYVKNRGEVKCADCGFTPMAEASGALDLSVGSIISGWRTLIMN